MNKPVRISHAMSDMRTELLVINIMRHFLLFQLLYVRIVNSYAVAVGRKSFPSIFFTQKNK